MSVTAASEVLLLSEVYANQWAEMGQSVGRSDLTTDEKKVFYYNGRPPDRPQTSVLAIRFCCCCFGKVNVHAPTEEARRPKRPNALLSGKMKEKKIDR